MLQKTPKLLVLDGQGVVFDAPFREFLRVFAHENGLDHGAVVGRWEAGLRHLAWTGNIDDEGLWNELAGRRVNLRRTMCSLRGSYRPGPAAAYLLNWSQLVPIWLLSNHRSDWVTPVLDAIDVLGVFQRLLISDTTGLVKPDPAAFRQLTDSLAGGDILFVDDQLHNIKAAERLGLQTVYASPDGRWVNEVDNRLRTPGRLGRLSSG